MRIGKIAIVIGLAVAIALLLFKKAAVAVKELVAIYWYKFEGFSAKPYWDYKQWSWGYGTKVLGSVDDKNQVPTGTISRPAAFAAAWVHAYNDFTALDKKVSIDLTGRQWAAYISFAYNLGLGNALKIVDDINSKSWEVLKQRWLSFHNAGGKPSDGLKARRQFEWEQFSKDI